MGVRRATCKTCGNPGSRITGKMHRRAANCRVSSLFFFFSFPFVLKAENGRLDVQSTIGNAFSWQCSDDCRSEWLKFPERENHFRAPHMSLRHCPSTSKARQPAHAHLPVYRRPSPSVSSPSEERHHTSQSTCYR